MTELVHEQHGDVRLPTPRPEVNDDVLLHGPLAKVHLVPKNSPKDQIEKRNPQEMIRLKKQRRLGVESLTFLLWFSDLWLYLELSSCHPWQSSPDSAKLSSRQWRDWEQRARERQSGEREETHSHARYTRGQINSLVRVAFALSLSDRGITSGLSRRLYAGRTKGI